MSRGIYDKVNKVRVPTAGLITPPIDHELSSSSQNAVENRILNEEFNKVYNAMPHFEIVGETAVFINNKEEDE